MASKRYLHLIDDLKNRSKEIRIDTLKRVYETGKGHIGGTFSCIDILVALYYNIMSIEDPKSEKRDRLVIGKGHACLALYNIFKDFGWLDNIDYGKDGSLLGGQLNIDTLGVEYNTGSLGHAVGVGAGMALAAELNKQYYTTYVLIGDGECAEGSIWEAISFAVQKELDNLIIIVDRNRLSVTDTIDDPYLDKKFEAFGCDVITIDGHNFRDILHCFDAGHWNRNLYTPYVIIAETIKGKGISFMENGIKWHHGVPNETEYKSALRELEGKDQIIWSGI